MKLLLSQREICSLLSGRGASQAVSRAVAEDMGLAEDSPEVAFAMSAFASFYAKFYNACSAGEKGRKLDVLREVEVPEVVLLILKALGFSEQETAQGTCLRAAAPGA